MAQAMGEGQQVLRLDWGVNYTNRFGDYSENSLKQGNS